MARTSYKIGAMDAYIFSTTSYHKLPQATERYRKLPIAAVSSRKLQKATESYRKPQKASAPCRNAATSFRTPGCAEGSPRARQNLASPAKTAEQAASISSRRSAVVVLSPSPCKESAANRKTPPSSCSRSGRVQNFPGEFNHAENNYLSVGVRHQHGGSTVG